MSDFSLNWHQKWSKREQKALKISAMQIFKFSDPRQKDYLQIWPLRKKVWPLLVYGIKDTLSYKDKNVISYIVKTAKWRVNEWIGKKTNIYLGLHSIWLEARATDVVVFNQLGLKKADLDGFLFFDKILKGFNRNQTTIDHKLL